MKDQGLVDLIDPTLVFRRSLYLDTHPVYEVERGSQVYVLKARKAGESDDEMPMPNDRTAEQHLRREKEVLEKAVDVEGIIHLVHDYGIVEGYRAILEEFAEGEALDDRHGESVRSLAIEQLKRTVAELHSLGIANIDLHQQNLIVSPDGSMTRIVDLGFCVFESDCPLYSVFSEYKYTDTRILGSATFGRLRL